MNSVRMGEWLQPLGHLVSAASDRDLSAEDQRQQLEYAHTELYKELRHMDQVQHDLLAALEECVRIHGTDRDGWPTTSGYIGKARDAIARARGVMYEQ